MLQNCLIMKESDRDHCYPGQLWDQTGTPCLSNKSSWPENGYWWLWPICLSLTFSFIYLWTLPSLGSSSLQSMSGNQRERLLISKLCGETSGFITCICSSWHIIILSVAFGLFFTVVVFFAFFTSRISPYETANAHFVQTNDLQDSTYKQDTTVNVFGYREGQGLDGAQCSRMLGAAGEWVRVMPSDCWCSIGPQQRLSNSPDYVLLSGQHPVMSKPSWFLPCLSVAKSSSVAQFFSFLVSSSPGPGGRNFWWFSWGVFSLPSLSSGSFLWDGIWLGLWPQVFSLGFLWPSDLQDVPQAAVDKAWHLFWIDCIGKPCFGSI